MYASGRRTPNNVACPVPSDVLEEWCLSLLLAPARIVDLTSSVSTDIVATDASTSCGLGVSIAKVDIDIAEQVLTYDDGQGDFITIALDHDDPVPKQRKGVQRPFADL